MKPLIFLISASFLFINCTEVQEVNTITTLELKELLFKDKIQLIDVRTQREIKQGSIETALFIDFFDKEFLIKVSRTVNKRRPVYLYCRSGNRSGKATNILLEKGFEVYNVIGGYTKWQKENNK
ncbi:rhodanese-like domain-containing protein [uncultured Polaribacter sp.]|uniref:rhodanese-like domain-containing protein n=1 Tax=uncultured Polaribacter sp. TaxID=174711 RepID=UPI002635EAED|nr:rhodanese-like domain-containing protein [uncultured Polaribacter sp.]